MAVRRERVILELEDQFSSRFAGPVAAVAAFDKSLGDLDRTSVRADRNLTRTSTSIDRTGKTAGRSSREIDRFSGRLRVLADVAAILGPALVPIGAVAVPAVTGLAAQFGAAAIASGTALAAFQGVGDALEAVNEAALEPSAKNLEAARIAMQNLGPEARDLVRQVQEMRPAFTALRDAAAAGLFPGLVSALDEAGGVFYRVEQVLFAVGDAAGTVAEEFAQGIAGPRGRDFLLFVQNEVPGALEELGRTVGNFTAGLAEMWMAFTPLNRDFSGWLLDVSESFDQWSQGLAETQGFEDFVAYLRTNGPRVADALGAIGGALLDIVEAAAPIGAALLPALEAVADVIGTIADSDAGPAIMATVTALALLNRGMAIFSRVSGSAWAANIRGAETFGARLGAIRPGRLAAAMAGLTVAATGVADSLGLANSASGALIGSIAGPWGAAVGGGVGLLMDFASASDEAAKRVQDLATALEAGGEVAARNNIVETLEAEGILRDAEELGLRLETVAAAAMGTKASIAALRAEQRALRGAARSQTDEFGFDVGPGSDEARERAAAIDHVIAAITGENEALNEARGSVERKEAANRGLGESYDRTAGAAQRFVDAVNAANRALSKDQSLVDYERSLDEARKTLRENGRTLDITTEKGRQNKEALIGIARSALEVSENLKQSNRIEFLKQARGDIVDAATKLGMTKQEARELADRLLGLDKIRANPKIDVDASGAMRTLSEVDRWLNLINGKRATTYIDTIRSGARTVPGLQMASGGTVPGQRWPYGDKTLIFAAPGEEIITNRHGEADRFRADRAAGRIPAYADGGQVAAMNHAGMSAPSGGGGARVVERVVERLPEGRVVAHVEGFGEMALRFTRNAARSEIAKNERHHDMREGL